MHHALMSPEVYWNLYCELKLSIKMFTQKCKNVLIYFSDISIKDKKRILT